MDFDHSLDPIDSKDTSAAFQALKELEALSDTSDLLYPHIDKFISMISSQKYVLRVRGFRLFCKQVQWDTDNVIDRHLDSALGILRDKKPTAVRQALAALHTVVRYKKHLREQIRRQVLQMDDTQYKDTLRPLIAKNRDALLDAIDSAAEQAE